MTNETTGVSGGSVEELIVELVAEDVVPQLVKKMTIGNTVKHYVWSGPSQVINVAQGDYLTFADLNEGTANSYEEYTTTDRQLTPILVGTTLLLTWESLNHPSVNVHDLVVDAISTAWATYTDDALADLYTEAPSGTPDHEIGTDATALDFDDITAVVQLLMTAGAPQPYALTIHPIQWAELLTDATLVENIMIGRGQLFAQQDSAPNNAYFMGHIAGVDVWISTSMNESSGLHAMGYSDVAMGVARKYVATDNSPTPELLKVETDWDINKRGREVAITICEDVGGTAFTNTTNKFMVDLIS